MEGLTLNAYKGLKRYWSRKGYERLNGPPAVAQTSPTHGPARLGPKSTGAAPARRRRRRRLKIGVKISLKKPKRWLNTLRDAYVNMMLKFAGSTVSNGGCGNTVVGRISTAAIKEYDERAIAEIYKSVVMAQGHMLHRDAHKLASQAVCCRR